MATEEFKTVTIEVNGHKVEMPEGPATGLEIKDAAIKHGVAIQPNFVLQQELPNGTSKVIGDDDKVDVRENLSFTAKELKTVTIEVNGHKVEMPEGPATGLKIKDAAIKHGVAIQPNFVLQQELPNGTSKVIGDDDKVDVRENLSFTAIAPDDNS